MKTRTLLLLVFISLSAEAQNWQPINKAWHYNYRFHNANIVTNTILVDSTRIIGTDSVFYLNRILLDCDTCHASSFGPQYNCDSCFVLGNQPQFLQRSIIKKQNGIYQLKDTGNIVLQALVGLNTSWLFDSVWNISATVISANLENILGTIDSVKTILLSSGDTIKFSKNFGITLYPYNYGRNKYHRLAGIEQLQIGEHVPDYKDFYDFSIGDEYLYDLSYTLAGSPIMTGTYSKMKLKVLTKSILNDTLIYTFKSIISGHTSTGNNMGGPVITNNFTYSDTLVKTFTNNDESNKYNNFELVDNINYFPTGKQVAKLMLVKDSTTNLLYKKAGLLDGENQYLSTSNDLEYTGINNGYMNCDSSYLSLMGINISNVFMYNPQYFYCRKVYKQGLGLINHGFSYFEISADTNLIAYTKNGITVGNMIADDILLSTKNISPKQKIVITPNPCSTCHISGIESPSDILVFDILGQCNTQPIIKLGVGEFVIDMENYASGIYFVRNLKSGEIIKFVKR